MSDRTESAQSAAVTARKESWWAGPVRPIYEDCGTNRTSVYELRRAAPVYCALADAGLVVEGRDVATGRKVNTILLYLGRAFLRPHAWGEYDGTLDAASQQFLVDQYLECRDWPLGEIRKVCQAIRPSRTS